MSQPNGHHIQPQALTSENLSQIQGQAPSDTSLQRYLQARPKSQPYYLPDRAPDRESHQQQLKEQMAQIEAKFNVA
ncbi:uncharacterized protein TRUGW13939_00660 [Talaromyces rugulosus]|uniref:Uncharacterized protein n=1 Tax=Talaromyces rugulosus TaxID=121627 RepID=A0A7H8QJ60_TALRU|nr:uncharacterized protein TRUGW13939_00660 [Talaromyces rugulosus]QKX53581.1 hypothetical protein TRUGW13939_00660 [Talaromyces rugulosus]